MSDVNASAVIHADQQAEVKTSQKNQGALKTEGGKEHSIYPFTDTESVSQGVSEFLNAANEQELSEPLLADHTFTEITPETIEIENEIMGLEQELEKTQSPEKNTQKSETQSAKQPEPSLAKLPGKTSEPIYSSLFSLAQSFNKGLSEARQKQRSEKQQPIREDATRPNHPIPLSTSEKMAHNTPESETRYDQEGQEKEEEGFGGQQQQQQQKDKQQKNKKPGFKVKASRGVSKTRTSRASSSRRVGSSNTKRASPGGGIDNIFIRFMALMARILGQAEAEAHELYLRIKERTDNIDLLTLFISKINSEKGAIDWSENEEMKELVDKARALGVDIPEGKYKWSEDEKKLLKENIQMRKDSMEKITQLERTDMQRYLQEASHCHQARSNVLKLLKEVTDTIIHNMRP